MRILILNIAASWQSSNRNSNYFMTATVGATDLQWFGFGEFSGIFHWIPLDILVKSEKSWQNPQNPS